MAFNFATAAPRQDANGALMFIDAVALPKRQTVRGRNTILHYRMANEDRIKANTFEIGRLERKHCQKKIIVLLEFMDTPRAPGPNRGCDKMNLRCP